MSDRLGVETIADRLEHLGDQMFAEADAPCECDDPRAHETGYANAKLLREAAAELRALRETLQEIADPPRDGCGCEHDTKDCCANVADYHCPECIAFAALSRSITRDTGGR